MVPSYSVDSARRARTNVLDMEDRRQMYARDGDCIIQYAPSLSQYHFPLISPFTAFCVGLGLRFGLHAQPESKGIYIAEYLFVVLSPCGFIAANYVLLGRLSRWLRCDRHLLIRPQKITLVFVMSDVITFLVQVCYFTCVPYIIILTLRTGSRRFRFCIKQRFDLSYRLPNLPRWSCSPTRLLPLLLDPLCSFPLESLQTRANCLE